MISAVLISLRRYVWQNPTYLTIVIGVLLVSYQQWAGPLSVASQVIICAGLLLVAGIPHGALDHLVEQERSIRRGQRFSMPRFIGKYVLTILIYGVGWLFAPVLSLVLFLLISAWHFGETDIENAPAGTYWSLTRFVAGGLVLAFILLTHAAETTPILARIVQNHELTLQFWHGAVSQTGAVLHGWAMLTAVLVVLSLAEQPIAINGWRLARLFLVLLMTYFLPLLPAFMLYFGGWHALSSFGTIRSYLHQPGYSLQSVWKLWCQSMPLTIVAFAFFGVSTGIWYTFAPDFDPLPALFILLSTITLPHIQIMHRLNN